MEPCEGPAGCKPNLYGAANSQRCQDLGADFLDRLDRKRLTCYHVKRLERLRHKVALEPPATA
jgi:hypothetical protein